MRREYAAFRDAGVQVVVAGMGTPEQSRALTQQLGLPFPLLADPQRTAYRAFELRMVSRAQELRPANLFSLIRNLARHGGGLVPGQDTGQLGGSFLIDGTGTIRYARAAARSSEMVDIPALLGAAAGNELPGRHAARQR